MLESSVVIDHETCIAGRELICLSLKMQWCKCLKCVSVCVYVCVFVYVWKQEEEVIQIQAMCYMNAGREYCFVFPDVCCSVIFLLFSDVGA